MLPDVVVNISGAAAPRGLDTVGTIAQHFATGVTQRGSSTHPILLKSFGDYQTFCGTRTTAASLTSDWVETFFAEKGKTLYLSRVFGSGATAATLNLMDGSAAISLVVSAGCKGDPDPGVWANGATGGIQVAVLVPAEGGFQLQVSFNGQVVETSPIFATQADAVGWGSGVNKTLYSRYITVALGVSTSIPQAAAAAPLTGGLDGTAVANTDWQAALDRIGKELGSGQVSAIGATTSVQQLQVIAHAVANRRYAILDSADTSSDTTIITAAQALYAAPNNGRRWAEMHTPWEVIPGVTAFTTRTVPPSARAGAQYQQVDALGNPNQAAAGRFGIAQFVQDLSQPNFTDTQREALANAGVTVSRRRFPGRIVTYDMITLADQVNDKDWMLAPNVRAVMWYAAQASVIGERHFGDQLDAFGSSLSDFKVDLTGPAKALFDKGALYGSSPDQAYYIDTGPSVNTPTTEALGQELATVKLRFSSAGRQPTINIVKTPLTQTL